MFDLLVVLAEGSVPEPPTIHDPITWIAVIFVLAVLGVAAAIVVWVPQAFDRLIATQTENLAAFRQELRSEREANADAVARLRDDASASAGKVHARLDGMNEHLAVIRAQTAHRNAG